MDRTKITGKIHYVGVNDRQKERFEGLWELPYGVSYNSYLIDDEKVALVDTVDVAFLEGYLKKIKDILGNRTIDYLIINHMEPDHSGAIRLIKKEYPNITIIGNKLTFNMLEGFYGVSDNLQLVKDKDCLELGYHTLRFYMTPMVHWPETMMTFDETDGAIFSGDGFGCYGALNGSFLDSRINTDLFWGEMERYYSTIVGRYGVQVQNAFKKIGVLPIKIICSTHGPVWTGENVEKVIGVYDRLSKYEAYEGVVIAYGSMYGNTEEMAEIIAEELTLQGIKNVCMHNVSKSDASYIVRDIFRYKGLIIGTPTYNNIVYPGIEALLSKLKNRLLKNRYLGCFGSFSWAGGAIKQLTESIEDVKLEIVADSVEVKHSLRADTEEQCRALARSMADRLKKDRVQN